MHFSIFKTAFTVITAVLTRLADGSGQAEFMASDSTYRFSTLKDSVFYS